LNAYRLDFESNPNSQKRSLNLPETSLCKPTIKEHHYPWSKSEKSKTRFAKRDAPQTEDGRVTDSAISTFREDQFNANLDYYFRQRDSLILFLPILLYFLAQLCQPKRDSAGIGS